MKKPSLALLGKMLLLSTLAAGWSGCSRNPGAGPSSQANELLVARGRYLVHAVAMCIDCHTPRGEGGVFIPGKDLAGAPIDFKALHPMPWAPAAPRLAGLPAGYTKEQMTQYLMDGTRPGGLPPTLPPMPSYRMRQADAAAIAAYLASLPKEGKESGFATHPHQQG